jgi:hypothetical protein
MPNWNDMPHLGNNTDHEPVNPRGHHNAYKSVRIATTHVTVYVSLLRSE